MQAYVDRGVYAGISTLIARRGKVVHAEQFGWRDKEAQSPMSADTIFRLYSMTKPIVCTAPDDAARRRRVARSSIPLAKYVPAFGRREGAGGRRQPCRSGAPDHAARSDDPHQRPDLPFRRRVPGRQNVPAGQAPGREMSAGSGDRRSRPVSARLPARFALAIQRRHRRDRPRDRSDLRPTARRFPARATVRAARDGRHRLRGPARKKKPPGGDVWPSRRDRRQARP